MYHAWYMHHICVGRLPAIKNSETKDDSSYEGGHHLKCKFNSYFSLHGYKYKEKLEILGLIRDHGNK